MQKRAEPKYKQIERRQLFWGAVDFEKLVGPSHPARIIWELTGRLDLSAFESKIRSYQGEAGSPAWPPRLLLSVWLYAYQTGVSSANRLTSLMEWEPGLQWLCGCQIINVHTLCDFRATHREALDSLLQQLLALLSEEGLVEFGTVVQDGTKIQARAGKGSGRRRESLQHKLAAARAYMEKVDAESHETEGRSKQQAAQERAARERVERLEAAYEEMQQGLKNSKQKDVRVSETEPEARRMRHSEHGGWMYSYNVQFSTEPGHHFIVGVQVTQDQNDVQQLRPVLDTVQHFTGQKPERVIADSGYVTRDSVKQMAEAGVELVAPLKEESRRQAHVRKKQGIAPEFDASRFTPENGGLRCPAGELLVPIGQKKHHGELRQIYEAEGAACGACPSKPRCCPQAAGHGRRLHRVVEHPAVRAHGEWMKTERARALYAIRGKVAEFPHMRMKANWGLRRFSVRGRAKASAEALLMVLAYNFSQWMWVLKRQTATA